MINSLRIFDDLKETLDPIAARKLTNVITLIRRSPEHGDKGRI